MSSPGARPPDPTPRGEPFGDDTARPTVRGIIHRPVAATGDGLVLTHGAGSSCESPLLRALAEAFAAAGWTVLRCDLPYRQERAAGPPPRGAGERDRAGLRSAVASLRAIIPRRVFLGGHSYGGRQATMAAAEDAGLCSALLVLSYPLHPPRHPEKARIEHLPSLAVPALFVHGGRDPFATLDELRAAVGQVPARTDLLGIEGAGHDLTGRKPAGELAARVLEEFRAFIDGSGSPLARV